MDVKLGHFEGSEVRATTLVLRNAGDGLSAAMKVDPTLLHKGQEITIAIRGTVVDVQFPPVDKEVPGGDCLRKHIVSAQTATIIDADVVDKALQAQYERILRARDEQTGVQHLGDVE